MTSNDHTEAVNELLAQTEAAHGIYETTELGGVYHKEWAEWYAAYAVDHGIAQLVGHPVTADQLAAFLASTYAEFQRAEPKPAEPWAAWTSRRITAEL
jgi:hypothetical protein